MFINYVATRSIVAPHIALEAYDLNVFITDAVRSRSVDKSVVRSASGKVETLYHSVDTTWQITFAPVGGDERLALQEFLDSTASGDAFTVRIYGDELFALPVRRSDAGYAWTPFMRIGGGETDLFTTSMTITEIA